MERTQWQKILNPIIIALTGALGFYFLRPSSEFQYTFAIGSFVITLLFVLNYWVKMNITIIFLIMILYMLAGLRNWPIKEGEKIRGFEELLPSILPFASFILLALLYWENRNRY